MLARILDNLRYPQGAMGAIIIRAMDLGHRSMTGKVLDRVGLKRGDVVLDIGCGGGGAIYKMAAQGAVVHGIDQSPVAVGAAIKKNRASIERGSVQIREGSANNLPFADNTFDWVTAIETLYFWENIRKCFSEVMRVLKPNGGFTVALGAYLENGKKIRCPPLLNSLNLKLYSAEDLRGLAETSGFTKFVSVKIPKKNGWLCVGCKKSPEQE